MKTITLTPVQRLSVRAVIRAQTPSSMELLETLSDILGKINFSPEEIKSIDNGDGTANVAELMAFPDIDVSFEKAEVKLLESILKPSDRFRPTVNDLPWLKPLVGALSKE